MLVSIHEAAKLLCINYKRIERAWRQGAFGDPQGDLHKRGPKRILLDLDAIRAYGQSQYWFSGAPMNLGHTASEVETLRQRVASLEHKILQLQEQKTYSSYVPSLPSSVSALPDAGKISPKPRTSTGGSQWGNYKRVTTIPDMPATLLAFAKLYEAHGIAASSTQAQRGKIYRVEGFFKVGKATNVLGISYDEAQKALQHWAKRGRLKEETIGCHVCAGDPTIQCPCNDEIFANELRKLISLSEIFVPRH